MILRLLASGFEHMLGGHEDEKQLIEDHDSDFSTHCAPSLD